MTRLLDTPSVAPPVGPGPPVRIVDLFAGIGGFRRGFEPHRGEVVWTCEIDRYALRTYRANFRTGGVRPLDVRDVDPADIPEHDLLVAGFPCQPFSRGAIPVRARLGQPHGFADEAKGTLFFDIARILLHWRPAGVLLENVPALEQHDEGRTMAVILRVLRDLGYSVSHRVIDAAGFVPQRRRRLFIAAFLRPGFSLADVPIPDPAAGPRLDAVLHPEDGSEPAEPPYTTGPTAEVDARYLLSPGTWEHLQRHRERSDREQRGFGFRLVGPDDVHGTLISTIGSSPWVIRSEPRPRWLTPRERARLMGLDWPGRPRWRWPVSDTRARFQAGEAVCPPVVDAIARCMVPFLDGMRT